MTAEQVFLIRRSFAEVSRHGHVAALVFYRRLFEIDPALRRHFTHDIEEQSRRLVEMLERPHGLELELRAMGSRHAGYGVEEAHYATVGAALVDMLVATPGLAFTPEVREAWTARYGVVAVTMKAGAAEAAEVTRLPRDLAA